MMNTKISIRFLLPIILIGVVIILTSLQFSTLDYPEDVLYDQVAYAIDPQTIIVSLEKGESDIFQIAPPEPEVPWPILWPSSSFRWSQDDYIKVANALHTFVWKEPLENWHLIRASFQIEQCQDIFGDIDSAALSFFQRQGRSNIVHGFWINPTYGNVTAGNQFSHRSGWTNRWETIDLNMVQINNVDAALLVAEENGGMEARSVAMNECKISVLLAPDRFEHDFLSHPFRQYGWGWSVIYWSKKSDADPIFSITIDPYTGKFKISQNE